MIYRQEKQTLKMIYGKKNLFKNDLWVREKTVMKITKYLDLQM